MGFLAIHAYLLYITRKICESLQKIFHGVLIEKDKEKNKKNRNGIFKYFGMIS